MFLSAGSVCIFPAPMNPDQLKLKTNFSPKKHTCYETPGCRCSLSLDQAANYQLANSSHDCLNYWVRSPWNPRKCLKIFRFKIVDQEKVSGAAASELEQTKTLNVRIRILNIYQNYSSIFLCYESLLLLPSKQK